MQPQADSPSKELLPSSREGPTEARVLAAWRDSASARCGEGCSARKQIVLTLTEKSSRAQWPGSGVLRTSGAVLSAICLIKVSCVIFF